MKRIKTFLVLGAVSVIISACASLSQTYDGSIASVNEADAEKQQTSLPDFKSNKNYGLPLLAPDVKEEMLSADYWIASCKNPKNLLMTRKEIDLWNQVCADTVLDDRGDFYIRPDLRYTPSKMTAEQIRKNFVYYNPSVPWYKKVETKNGTVIRTVNDRDFKAFWQEMNLSPLVSWKDYANQKWIPMPPNKTEYKVRKAVCVRRSNLRLVPEERFYSDDKEYWYDDAAQNSGILMNEPVLVLWKSLDEKWLYVYTGYCYGWIHKEDIAYCTDEQFERYFDYTSRDDFVTVVVNRVQLTADYLSRDSIRKDCPELLMGTYLNLAEIKPEDAAARFGGRVPYASWIVEIPQRKKDGTLGFACMAVPAGICKRGLLPYTQENVIRLAFMPLGERYGWGGMADSRDCSEYLMDIFRCFGFNLPRNSRTQLSVPGKTVDFKDIADSEKLNAVKNLEPGTIMGFPGHVFLYLGTAGNKPYVISALGSYHPDSNFDKKTDANSVNINTLDASRKNGKTWLEVVTRAKMLNDDGTFQSRKIYLDSKWEYSSFSKINSGAAILYKAKGKRKNITVAVNAGHGTSGGQKIKTFSHPDKSPKVTGGTSGKGSVESISISNGMVFKNGESEASVNLKVAIMVKEKLLKEGFDVLMLRPSGDVQLDNIARTVIANNNSDLHLSIHFDSDGLKTDKGCFWCGIPEETKKLKTVSRHWKESERFGSCFVSALKESKLPVFKNGKFTVDLTQTAYSTIPTADIELGNQASAINYGALEKRADAIVLAIKKFYQ